MAVLGVGLDWCTLTNILSDGQKQRSLMSIFLEESPLNTKWQAGGYRGLQDIDGKLKFGSRTRSDGRADELLVCSGPRAGGIVDEIGDVSAYRCTRLDIQVTIKLDGARPKLSSDMYDELLLKVSLGEHPTGRRKFSHIRSRQGDTLYIGTRKTGRKFFRFYDKGFDLGSEKGLIWRVEVQYGRDLADEALRVYVAIRRDAEQLTRLVSSEFYMASGFSPINGGQVDGEVIAETGAKTVDATRKLDWLAACVKPTIAFLLREDLESEMLDALGLRRD